MLLSIHRCRSAFSVAFLGFVSLTLNAADAQTGMRRCIVRAVSPTGAIEIPESVMAAGSLFGPITQIRVERSTGRISFCAHGSYCYPSTNLEFVTPCKIDSRPQPSIDKDGTEWLYSPR